MQALQLVLYFVRKGEDAEMAARRIQIRVPGRPGGCDCVCIP
jgi:hypothetical protein